MKVPLYQPKKVRVEMIPLIDMVFLLLVFFIYAMVSMTVHRGVPVLLPTSDSAQIEKTLVLSVTLKTDGTVYIDKEPIEPNKLAGALIARAKGEQDAGVLLFADRTIPYQALFGVLDEIRKAGIARVSLQAEAATTP